MLIPPLHSAGLECWKGSSLIISNVSDIPAPVVENTPAFVSAAIIITLFCVVCTFNRITISEAVSFGSLFNATKLPDTMQNKNIINAVNSTGILCTLVLSLLIYADHFSSLNYLFIMMAFAAYTIVKHGLYRHVGWMKECPGMFSKLSMNFKMHLIVFTTLAIAVYAISSVFRASQSSKEICIIAAGAICFILFSFRSVKIFLEEKHSLLFWFLYLCTLEILPLELLISVLIRL